MGERGGGERGGGGEGRGVYGCGHIERTWSVSQLIIDVHFPWSRVFSAE